MKTLPGGRVKLDEEEAYLAVCHKIIRNRPDVRIILEDESFFDAAARRSTANEWSTLRGTTWPGTYSEITGVSIMSALRAYLSELQNDNCCYCGQTMLLGGYSRQLDHVLPASVYGRFSFHFWNLAVACERCNRIKKDRSYQPISPAAQDYPEHTEFSDFFHPRFHSLADHIRFGVTATPDYSYIVFAGVSRQGMQLVNDVLQIVALEVTRESNNPVIKAAAEKIRSAVRSQGVEAQAAVLRFEDALRQAIEAGAA
ncbi:HNH endonuclease [Xanthomonas arboricola]|uniref:HNH endonuclease n=1 Tax=Xanthomonas arboricola TaxID=56448 RepID=UPI003EBAD643